MGLISRLLISRQIEEGETLMRAAAALTVCRSGRSISDISRREEWRHHSVFEGLDLLLGQVYGKGPDGYREALELIAEKLNP